ncbi:MAG: SDR family oxidoreductase [Dehalococcoidia bacterium]|nr:SDR family oxidoreductase [Chloroflexi bacterium CFX7]MCK6565048.1 SDR family oxidoreductase [Dehalococcoidia bacterium]NUQ56262.1 SDR family oxidoreductase [Dehalococcoidia bacterium]RIL01882.1 MAG: 2-deoxy-D-gluconate 3-dehydrogenase [bacterium]
MNLFDLSGEVAFITGGNGGIGRGIALGLASAGADIAIAARDSSKSQSVRAEVEALGRRAVAVDCDVTSRTSIDGAVKAALDAFGKISVVVNNAGIGRSSPPETLSEDDWDAVVDTNLKGTLLVSQACFGALVANGRGKIINIGSEYSLFGSAIGLPYGASKGGVITLTYGLADAWAVHNIQVNALLPGVIETDIWRGSLAVPDFRARLERRTPAARIGLPEDMAGPAVFLASRASDFVTGQWFAVDGGVNIADPVIH